MDVSAFGFGTFGGSPEFDVEPRPGAFEGTPVVETGGPAGAAGAEYEG